MRTNDELRKIFRSEIPRARNRQGKELCGLEIRDPALVAAWEETEDSCSLILGCSRKHHVAFGNFARTAINGVEMW